MTRRELAALTLGTLNSLSSPEVPTTFFYTELGRLSNRYLDRAGILTNMHVGMDPELLTSDEDLVIEWLLGQVKNMWVKQTYLGMEFVIGKLNAILQLTPAERLLCENLKGIR